MTPPFTIEPLSATHDRKAFRCGIEALDRYFREQISQDVRRRIATAFVATEAATGRVAGYYTLAAASIPMTDLTQELKLPRYPSIPAVLVGRLAVDRAFRGQGLGGAMLADALHRIISTEIGSYAMLVDAKGEAAVAFYRHHGFLPFATNARRLFLPIATARGLFDEAR